MLYNHKKRILGLLIFLLPISSCSKIDLEEFAALTLVTNWNNRTPEITIPESYNVRIGDQNYVFGGDRNILPKLGLGTHTAYIYNNAAHIEVEGTVAKVSQRNGVLEPMPGWLFTSSVSFENRNNLVEVIDASMRQETRELEIMLKPIGGSADRMENIEANLMGVAGAWDFRNNIAVGPNMSVPLQFTKQSDGNWTAKVRLLGIMGSKQELIGVVHFVGGRPLSLNFSSDMSQDLSDFNTDKPIVMQLQAALETANEAGFSTEITDWVKVNESGVAW